MKGLANFLTKGRPQAIIGLSFLTMMSALLPPLAHLLSGTPLSFIALRQGANNAIQVIAGSLCVLALLFLLAGIDPKTIALFALGLWIPLLITANVLRITQSQGWMLVVSGLIAILFILYTHQQTASVTADNRQIFEVFWQKSILPNISPNTSTVEVAAMKQMLDRLIPFMNGIRASLLAFSIISTVMLARWWQSKIYNPGGFRKEFLALQLPKWLLVIMAICAGIVFMNASTDDSIARDSLVVLMTLYVFQGVACVHAFVARKPEQRGWLIGMYIALVFVSLYAAVILACIGVADSVIGRKLPGNTT